MKIGHQPADVALESTLIAAAACQSRVGRLNLTRVDIVNFLLLFLMFCCGSGCQNSVSSPASSNVGQSMSPRLSATSSPNPSRAFIASEIRAPFRVDYYTWDGSTVWATGFDLTNSLMALGHLVDGRWVTFALPPIRVRGGPPAADSANVYVPSLSTSFAVVDKVTRVVRVYSIPARPVLPNHPVGLSQQALGGMAVGPDGRIWYITQNTAFIGNFDPATGKIQEVPIPITECKFGLQPVFVGTTLYWIYKQSGQLASYNIVSGAYREVAVMPDTVFPLETLTPKLLARSAFIDGMAYDARRKTFWVLKANRDQVAAVHIDDAAVSSVSLGAKAYGVGILKNRVVCSTDDGWLVYDPDRKAVIQSIPFKGHAPGRLGAVDSSSPVNYIFAAEIESNPLQFSDGVARLLFR